MTLYGKKTLKAIQDGIDSAIPFKAGNVSGKVVYSVYDIGWGKFPESDKQAILDFIGSSDAFVIYSFKTPIAVNNLETGEWVIPEVWYSQTTNVHKNRIRVAIDNPGIYA